MYSLATVIVSGIAGIAIGAYAMRYFIIVGMSESIRRGRARIWIDGVDITKKEEIYRRDFLDHDD